MIFFTGSAITVILIQSFAVTIA